MPRRRRSAVGALGAFVALIAVIGYFQGATTPRAVPNVTVLPPAGSSGFVSQLGAFTSSTPTTANVTGLWDQPKDYFKARLDAIAAATRTIRFETFYMTPGQRADDFAAALIARAKAGVVVEFIVDAAGQSLPDAYWQRLTASGVKVKFYHPFNWRSPLRFESRTHRKILVVDGQVAFTGGAGVSDEWDGTEKDTAPWCDWEVRLDGPVAAAMEAVFAQHWAALGGDVHLEATASAPGRTPVLLSAASPADDESTMRWLYLATMRSAKHRLWIASPYFLPGTAEREAIVDAEKRGVDVRILTEGPRNDKSYAYWAMREQYGPLLDAGVPIFEYQPAFMHAKALLVDDTWSALGSANFDPRSFYLNDEMMLGLADKDTNARLAGLFEGSFGQSEQIDRSKWEQRPATQRWLGAAAWFFRFQL